MSDEDETSLLEAVEIRGDIYKDRRSLSEPFVFMTGPQPAFLPSFTCSSDSEHTTRVFDDDDDDDDIYASTDCWSRYKDSFISAATSFVIFVVEIALLGAAPDYTLWKNQPPFLADGYRMLFYIMHGIGCLLIPFVMPFSLKTEFGSNSSECKLQNKDLPSLIHTSKEYKTFLKEKERTRNKLGFAACEHEMTVKESSLTFNAIMKSFSMNEKIKFKIRVYCPVVMMFFNFIAGLIPDIGQVFFEILEFALVIYILYEPPYYSAYKYGMKVLGVNGKYRTIRLKVLNESGRDVTGFVSLRTFLCGELNNMLIGFIYLHVIISVSGLSYLLFYRTATGSVVLAFKDMFGLIDNIYSHKLFLAICSIFSLLVYGYGFSMSFRNSYLMLVPYVLFSIGDLFGYDLLTAVMIWVICIIHFFYLVFFAFRFSQKAQMGFNCECCYEYCRGTLNTLMFGNINGLLLFSFPMLFGIALSEDYFNFLYDYNPLFYINYRDKSSFGSFCLPEFMVPALFICFIAFILHCLLTFRKGNSFIIIFSCSLLVVGGLLMGYGFIYNDYFYDVALYECTNMARTIVLCICAYPHGYSPSLFMFYQIANAFFEMFEIWIFSGNFFWLVGFEACVQCVINFTLLPMISKFSTNYFIWTFFSSPWLTFIVLGIILALFILMLLIDSLLLICKGKYPIFHFVNKLIEKMVNHFNEYDDCHHTAGFMWEFDKSHE